MAAMAAANIMSPTSASPPSTWHHFDRKVEEVKPSKADINSLVMDYLVTNGYPAAAKRFAVEANIQPKADIGSIQERVEIRRAIHSGDIQAAIEKINELNPQILDADPSLHFSLLRLQLVELIRKCTSTPNGDITPALEFATSRLAPRAPTNPQFLEDLERTLALLIFPAESLTPALASLLHPDLRKDIATRVNQAILENQGARKEARLRNLVKLRAWAEQKAREKRPGIPDHLDIGLCNDKSKSNDHNHSSANGNSDDAVMTNDGTIDPMIV
ncbi:Glucose-induced degradation protein 8 homolog [Talaromyces islandicus]|uniref:Protein FYV10 n=1 Tax=Talaromyces islandicus TaxID=28573 RepID=A0A0U1M6D5_TALIS|nr:Glucose-induced degradation protein 8 homolog [Talaromyces islandicus]